MLSLVDFFKKIGIIRFYTFSFDSVLISLGITFFVNLLNKVHPHFTHCSLYGSVLLLYSLDYIQCIMLILALTKQLCVQSAIMDTFLFFLLIIASDYVVLCSLQQTIHNHSMMPISHQSIHIFIHFSTHHFIQVLYSRLSSATCISTIGFKPPVHKKSESAFLCAELSNVVSIKYVFSCWMRQHMSPFLNPLPIHFLLPKVYRIAAHLSVAT